MKKLKEFKLSRKEMSPIGGSTVNCMCDYDDCKRGCTNNCILGTYAIMGWGSSGTVDSNNLAIENPEQ